MSKSVKKMSVEDKAIAQVEQVSEARGFEEMSGESFTIPMLNIVQPLTPLYQQEGKDDSIKLGAIYDSVNHIGYKTVKVIPVMFRQRWLEWKPRTAGGGLVAIHETCPEGATAGEKGLLLPNGNSIVDTRQHYVIYLDKDDLYSPALLSMKSTSVKVSRNWCTQMRMNRHKTVDKLGKVSITTLNMYQRQYELSTTLMQKNSNQWHQWSIRMLPEPVEGYALEEAIQFYKLLRDTNKIDVQQTYQQATDSVDDVAY